MKEEEFMNQKVGEMTIGELAEAIKIKHKQIYEKIVPDNKDYMELMFEQKKTIKEEMESKLKSVMNEKGMVWCSSFVCSFINAANIIDYNKESMNKTMKRVTRIVWNTLCIKYDEFELKTINIPKVAMELISKVHTILLSSSHHIDNPFFDDFHKGMSGWGIFKKKEEKK